MKPKHRGQMSESFLTAVFLSLSGGLQDAYTYLFRGKVFANAQTGNIVLLSSNLMDGNWERVLHYLVPLCAFALGVLTAEKMQEHFRNMQRLHWRQLVVLGEVLLLLWAFCRRSRTCWPTPSSPFPAPCRCRRSAR